MMKCVGLAFPLFGKHAGSYVDRSKDFSVKAFGKLFHVPEEEISNTCVTNAEFRSLHNGHLCACMGKAVFVQMSWEVKRGFKFYCVQSADGMGQCKHHSCLGEKCCFEAQ